MSKEFQNQPQPGICETAFAVGQFFVSDLYAYYQDTYRGVLGKVQVEAVDYIRRSGRASVSDLARTLNIPKQHASKIAAKLEELGLVSRSPNPLDARGAVFSLTEEGSRFVSEHIEQSNRHLQEILERCGKEEQEELLRALQTVARVLELPF